MLFVIEKRVVYSFEDSNFCIASRPIPIPLHTIYQHKSTQKITNLFEDCPVKDMFGPFGAAQDRSSVLTEDKDLIVDGHRQQVLAILQR